MPVTGKSNTGMGRDGSEHEKKDEKKFCCVPALAGDNFYSGYHSAATLLGIYLFREAFDGIVFQSDSVDSGKRNGGQLQDAGGNGRNFAADWQHHADNGNYTRGFYRNLCYGGLCL